MDRPSSPPVSTRDRVIDALRWGDLTVEQLAAEVGLTLNGVRAQLAGLERDGVVRRVGVRHAGTAGKPPAVYGLTRAAEERLSQAYPPAMGALVEELREALGAETLHRILGGAGRRLGRGIGAAGPSQVLEALGARVSTAADRDGVVTVQGAGCPLGSVVRGEPATCELVRSVLATSLDTPVEMCCQHGDQPACRFRVGTPGG